MTRRFVLFAAMGLILMAVGVLIVESDEAYWWYGPPERMNWLVGTLVALGLFTLLAIFNPPRF